eukprot:scaffold12232_cov149-Amphora_coffeaeformis.AAC.1
MNDRRKQILNEEQKHVTGWIYLVALPTLPTLLRLLFVVADAHGSRDHISGAVEEFYSILRYVRVVGTDEGFAECLTDDLAFCIGCANGDREGADAQKHAKVYRTGVVTTGDCNWLVAKGSIDGVRGVFGQDGGRRSRHGKKRQGVMLHLLKPIYRDQ